MMNQYVDDDYDVEQTTPSKLTREWMWNWEPTRHVQTSESPVHAVSLMLCQQFMEIS